MNVYLSYDESDRAIADCITHRLGADGHSLISAASLDVADGPITDAIATHAKRADAYVLIISGSRKTRMVMCEWRAVLTALWEHPDKPLIGITVGNASVPPLLEGRHLIRVVDEEGLEAAAATLSATLHGPGQSPLQFEEEIGRRVEAKMERLSREISKFSIIKEDLLKELEWLVTKLQSFTDVSSSIKLQRKVDEILNDLLNHGDDIPAALKSFFACRGLPVLRSLVVEERNLPISHHAPPFAKCDDFSEEIAAAAQALFGRQIGERSVAPVGFTEAIIEACTTGNKLLDILGSVHFKNRSSDKTGGETC